MSNTYQEKAIESGCWIKLPKVPREEDKFSVIYTQGGEQTATYYRTRVVWAETPAALYGSINGEKTSRSFATRVPNSDSDNRM